MFEIWYVEVNTIYIYRYKQGWGWLTDFLVRLKISVTAVNRLRPRRKRTVRTSTLRKNVKLRIQRNPARSMRKPAKEMHIARESMRLLVRTELGMTPYKYQKFSSFRTKIK